MNAWRFHQWNGYVASMIAPAITGGAGGKLQRPQWQPGPPPRRRIRFCYCTIIEWNNTRFSHADWRIYASMNYVNIDLDNGLSPEQRQDSIQSRVESSITFQCGKIAPQFANHSASMIQFYTSYGDAKSSCTPSLSTVRPSAAAPTCSLTSFQRHYWFSSPPGQNGHHFADDNFISIFLN